MAEGVDRSMWRHTSQILSLIANVNSDGKTKAFIPDDFNPYVEADRNQRLDENTIMVTKDSMAMYRDAFR